MSEFLVGFLWELRGVFSRRTAFTWFVVVFAGFILRTDWLGVTSMVRALELSPVLYPHLLHFFHASSWSGEELLACCVKWLARNGLIVLRNGRAILIGDESKVPQEGRRMPSVKTLRQTSETSSKPSYFRGHEWGFLGILIGTSGKCFCSPAWARLFGDKIKAEADEKRRRTGDKSKKTDEHEPRTAGIVMAASLLAFALGLPAYLVLDAFYAVGPVFKAAAKAGNIVVITRAKCNCIARIPAAPSPERRGRGRPRQYDRSVKVNSLYVTEAERFEGRQAKVYGRKEKVRVLARILNWKVASSLVLFVLAETSHGRITLMCSDLNADPVDVLELYCYRSLIEVMFDNIKNLLGLMEYRFWSKHLEPQTRRPAKNGVRRDSTNQKATAMTLAAISNFLHVGLVLLAFLQALSCKFGVLVADEADCWLRTPPGRVPSVFMAKIAAGSILRRLLRGSASNPIAAIIHAKMISRADDDRLERAA